MDKIPPHAQRVFHGILFDVFQWKQKLFDGSTKTFEALRRIPSTDVILVDGDEIIIAEQEQPGRAPFLSLFGGQLDDGEAPLAGAKRELLEETGFEAVEWQLIEVANFPWAKLEYQCHLFVARQPIKVREPLLDGGERIIQKRVNFDEFMLLAATTLQWDPPLGLFQKIPNPERTKTLRRLLLG